LDAPQQRQSSGARMKLHFALQDALWKSEPVHLGYVAAAMIGRTDPPLACMWSFFTTTIAPLIDDHQQNNECDRLKVMTLLIRLTGYYHTNNVTIAVTHWRSIVACIVKFTLSYCHKHKISIPI